MLPGLAPLGVTSLIFGGCCSNVFALEAIVKHEPSSGLLITLTQFIFTVLCSWPSQFAIDRRTFFLKKTVVPFQTWAFSAAMFFVVNMLNNWAFAFDISVPVHIILRSFGSVTTMAVGWLRGRRYSRLQVLAVVILTIGVVISAWADAVSKGKSMDAETSPKSAFGMGLVVLLAAQILSAFMGVYVQDVYDRYGKHWDENLFYSHFLSLPFFFPLHATLRSQYQSLADSPPLTLSHAMASYLPVTLRKSLALTPQSIFALVVNSITQFLCISGVNLLSAQASAVTVTIILNIRKLVSFMFSIWLFGNKLSPSMVFGAVLVFGAGALYGWETSVGIKSRQATKAEQERKQR